MYWLKSSNSSFVNSKGFLVGILISLLLPATGCLEGWIKKNDDQVLARVYKKYLYQKDILSQLPAGLSQADSVAAIQGLINAWVKQQLFLHKAEENLKPEEKDFSKQLENYRNSLLTFEYENKIIREQLDTLVTSEEIEAFYNQNKWDFELKENIIKADYVQLDASTPDLRKLRNQFNSGTKTDKDALILHCRRNGLNYTFDKDEWVFFNDFIQEVPIRTYNQENFLKYNRNIEVRDSLYVYLVRINDFMIRESTAPLSMYENIIRNIILNRRKQELIAKLQEEILQQAVINNYFEIYQ